jgi:hypothetical protein
MILTLSLLLAVQATDDYVWKRPVWRDVDPAAADLRARLESEVKRLLALGHPKPAYYRQGIVQGHQLYGYGGETCYVLADVLPLLSPETQGAVKAYLTTSMGLPGRRPLQDGLYHGTSGWGNAPLDGLRREFAPVPSTYLLNVWPAPPIQPEALYMLWRYADATGDWAYVNANWAALTALYNNLGAPDRYGKIAALIGFARMAQRRGDATLASQAAASAVSGLNASNWNSFLSAANARAGLDMHNWAYPIFHYFRATNSLSGVLAAPEVGRFLRDQRLAEVQAAVDPKLGRAPADHANATCPAWFAYRSDYPYGEFGSWGPQNFQGGENSHHPPDFMMTFFAIRQQVYGDGAAALRGFVDFPTCVGDLYYFLKLAGAVRAAGTLAWVDVRNAADLAPTAVIASPGDGASFAGGAAVSLQGSATDPEDGAVPGGQLRWTSNRQGLLGTGATLSVSTLSAGVHILTLQATDSAGHVGYDQATITIGSGGGSGQVPGIPQNLAAAALSDSEIALTWTDASANETGFRVERRQGAGAWGLVATLAAGTTAWTDTGLPASTAYTYRVQAFNGTGSSGWSNEATASTSTPPPPTVSITQPTTNPTYATSQASVGLSGTASPGVTQVSWSSSAGGGGTATGTTAWSATVPLIAGTQTVTVTATSPTGTGTDSIAITYNPADTTAPVVTINPPGNPVTSPLALSGTATDAVGVVLVTWANSAGGSGAATGTWSASIPLAAGPQTITISATDAAGNVGTATLTVTYAPPAGDTQPPTVTIETPTANPTAAVGATPLALAGAAADDAGVVAVSWTNAATGQSGTAGGTSAWSASIPLAAGANVITVTALDAAGLAGSDAITVDYQAPAPPAAPSDPDAPNGECPLQGSARAGGARLLLAALAILAGLRLVHSRG